MFSKWAKTAGMLQNLIPAGKVRRTWSGTERTEAVTRAKLVVGGQGDGGRGRIHSMTSVGTMLSSSATCPPPRRGGWAQWAPHPVPRRPPSPRISWQAAHIVSPYISLSWAVFISIWKHKQLMTCLKTLYCWQKNQQILSPLFNNICYIASILVTPWAVTE